MILGVTFHLMLRGSLCTERNPSVWKPPVSTAKIMMGAQNSRKLSCPTRRAWPKLSTWTPLTDRRTVTSCHFQHTQAISPSQDSNHQMAHSFLVFSLNFPKLLPILILCNDLASDFTVNWSNLKINTMKSHHHIQSPSCIWAQICCSCSCFCDFPRPLKSANQRICRIPYSFTQDYHSSISPLFLLHHQFITLTDFPH